jgi:molybdopterin converting factor small subunit
MAITFNIPAPLRSHTGGRSHVEIDAADTTVAEALAVLWSAYPGLRDRIVTEQGNMREHLNIFIGEENIRFCGGLSASVPSGAAISIVPAVSGGRSLVSTRKRRRPYERRLRNERRSLS